MVDQRLDTIKPLTRSQTRVRDAIHRYYAAHHTVPSRRQIRLMTNIRSGSYVDAVVAKLHARGQMPERRRPAACARCCGTGYEPHSPPVEGQSDG